jgi:hypothetical protein
MAMPERSVIPEALVIGGIEADKAEVVSRMMGCGWRVAEHWLPKEGGHDWSRLPRGVKLIVVMRDNLDNLHYQRGTNLANIARIPFVKWDVNRDRFRERMKKIGLMFQLPKPAPSAVVATEAGPVVMQTPTHTEEQFPERRQRPRDALETLRAAAELMVEELATNPMFRGVTIRVLGEKTEIIPEARPILMATAFAGQEPQPPRQAHPWFRTRPRQCCKSRPRSRSSRPSRMSERASVRSSSPSSRSTSHPSSRPSCSRRRWTRAAGR